jgi:hypothetical protein
MMSPVVRNIHRADAAAPVRLSALLGDYPVTRPEGRPRALAAPAVRFRPGSSTVALA